MKHRLLSKLMILLSAVVLFSLFIVLERRKLLDGQAFHALRAADRAQRHAYERMQSSTETSQRVTEAPSQAAHPDWVYDPRPGAEHPGPFVIHLFLKEQVGAVYALADPGDQAAKDQFLFAFPISSGHVAGHTPLGKHQIGQKFEPAYLFDNSIAQYGSQIAGNILFHSLPSYDRSIYQGLHLNDVNGMGHPASHGCVRLYVKDAKWIYERCDTGTRVEIHKERGEAFQEIPSQASVLHLKEGAPDWDPTDTHENNPYRDPEVLAKWLIADGRLEDFVPDPPIWPSFPVKTSPPSETEAPSESRPLPSKAPAPARLSPMDLVRRETPTIPLTRP